MPVFEPGQELVEVSSRELPFERVGDLFIMASERIEALLDGVEVREVVRCQRLALHDREEDLGLVDPARVDGGAIPRSCGCV